MSIEIFDKIFSILRVRELGWKQLSSNVRTGSSVDWDVEDSFIELKDDIDMLPTPKPNPDSEPE